MIDITGERFGNFVALERGDLVDGHQYKWKFRCICGNVVQSRVNHMRSGKRVSCGCLGRPAARKPIKSYDTITIERAWYAMIDRCTNEDHPDYHNYGGRGITVCNRWFNNMPQFVLDMGPKPTSEHSLHRIDNEGNYEPSNCKWATREEQNSNRRPQLKFKHGVTFR
jgi:hypothetical protein